MFQFLSKTGAFTKSITCNSSHDSSGGSWHWRIVGLA